MTAWYKPVRLAIWGTWGGLALWSAAQWRTPNVAGGIPSAPALVPGVRDGPIDSSTSLLGAMLARMPFDNAEVLALLPESGPAPSDTLPSQTPIVQLTLSGIVDGRVQQAIIVGLPGTDGSRTLRVGERVGEARLLEVSAGRAVVAVNGARVELPLGKPILLSQ